MKKFISIALLLAMVLGVFAGCVQPEAETEATTQPQVIDPMDDPLQSAVAYLKNMYDTASKDQDNKLTADKELLPAVTIDGISYPITWTIDVTAGPVDAIVIADGAAAGTKKIDIVTQPEEEVRFTLVGVISDADGKTATIEIRYYSPAVEKVEVPTGKKVVIYLASAGQYMTGIDYLYTSSSGSQKHQLCLTTNKVEAVALTVQTNADGSVTFVTDNGMYLFCDATNVMFVAEQSDNTKFLLEGTEGGQLIKCAIANYNGKPQYLEVYNNYMTCYGISETSNLAIYTFELQDAEGANGTVGSGEVKPDPDPDPVVEAQLPEVTNPVEGTAYKFGMIQVTNGTTVYITGEVTDRYLVTTTDKDAAADVFVEAAEGGYKFYIVVDGAKLYIAIYDNDAGKRSVGFFADGNVFKFNAECGNWYTTHADKECYLGSYNNFETVSVSDTSYINKDNAGIKQFPAGFFAIAAEKAAPEVGVAYKMFVNHVTISKTLYFVGTTANKDYYLSTSENVAEAVDVYFESVEGGFRMYFMAGDVKTYIDIFQNGNYINLRLTDAPTAVYTWNAEFGTMVATLEDGTTTGYIGAYGTFETMSASSTSYLGGNGSFWVEFVKA